MLVAVAKGSEDIYDFYPHNNIVEFIVDGKPEDTVTNDEGNVSFDILRDGEKLKVTEVYAYRDGAMIEGNYREDGHWEER